MPEYGASLEELRALMEYRWVRNKKNHISAKNSWKSDKFSKNLHFSVPQPSEIQFSLIFCYILPHLGTFPVGWHRIYVPMHLISQKIGRKLFKKIEFQLNLVPFSEFSANSHYIFLWRTENFEKKGAKFSWNLHFSVPQQPEVQ